MTLDPRSIYPSTRCYVLKLHRDAGPAADALAGRLENMTSGRRLDFRTAAEMLAWLANELTPPAQKED